MKRRYFYIDPEASKVTEIPAPVGSALFRLVDERDQKSEATMTEGSSK